MISGKLGSWRGQGGLEVKCWAGKLLVLDWKVIATRISGKLQLGWRGQGWAEGGRRASSEREQRGAAQPWGTDAALRDGISLRSKLYVLRS